MLLSHKALFASASRRRWPGDPGQLKDDCWALGLSCLAELPEFDAWVGEHARLVGRALQPWRSLLAIAAWLKRRGAAGLWERMEALSLAYQEERAELETGDFTSLVIRAVIASALANDISKRTQNKDGDITILTGITNLTMKKKGFDRWEIKTELICKAAAQLAMDLELGSDFGQITTRRVGRALSKLRFRKNKRKFGEKTRSWTVTRAELVRCAQAYHLSLPDSLKPDSGEGDQSHSTISPHPLPSPLANGYEGYDGGYGYTGKQGTPGEAAPAPDGRAGSSSGPNGLRFSGAGGAGLCDEADLLEGGAVNARLLAPERASAGERPGPQPDEKRARPAERPAPPFAQVAPSPPAPPAAPPPAPIEAVAGPAIFAANQAAIAILELELLGYAFHLAPGEESGSERLAYRYTAEPPAPQAARPYLADLALAAARSPALRTPARVGAGPALRPASLPAARRPEGRPLRRGLRGRRAARFGQAGAGAPAAAEPGSRGETLLNVKLVP